MPILSYTTKKLLKSVTNWIILLLTIIGIGAIYFLTYLLNSEQIAQDLENIAKNGINANLLLLYKNYLWQGWQLGVMIFLISIFLFIFIAINTAKILRDEIDDGTLLILVSKPLSRWRIWGEKTLSLQINIIIYIFLSLFISGFLILIPGFGGIYAFQTFWPFFALTLGIYIVIELIISSLSFLISLFVRGIIVGSIVIGVGFIFIISNQVIDRFIMNSARNLTYVNLARASHTLKQIYNNIPVAETRARLLNPHNYNPQAIQLLMITLYEQYIFPKFPTTTYTFPATYSSQDEQAIFTDIVKNENINYYPLLTPYKSLITDIYYVSQTMLTDKNMSYLQMINGYRSNHNLTGYVIYETYGNSNYNLVKMYSDIKNTISDTTYTDFQNNLNRLITYRRVNIFYHLSYIWDGWFNNNFQNNYASPNTSFDFFFPWISDPYLIKLNKVSNDTYGINLTNQDFQNSGSKILDWKLITLIYGMMSIVIFGIALYLFLRKDFT